MEGSIRIRVASLPWYGRDHVAANLTVESDDFEYAPFAQEGGLGKVHQLFPEGLQTIIEALNMALVA